MAGLEMQVARLADDVERLKMLRESDHQQWNDHQEEILELCRLDHERLVKLEVIQTELLIRVGTLEAGQKKLEEGQQKLEEGQQKLEEGQQRLEAAQQQIVEEQEIIKALLHQVLDKLP